MRYGEEAGNTTPKLMLFADLRLSPDNPGRLTPPLYNMGSVPFRWEERPGKAIVVGGRNDNDEGAVSKSLELPPRLLRFISAGGKSSSKLIKLMPSPHNVLDSLYISNSSTVAPSFRFMANSPGQERRGKSLLGLSNRGSARRRRSLSFSNAVESKSGIDQIKRGRSLAFVSKSHFWEKICGGLKQLMPWRKRQEENN